PGPAPPRAEPARRSPGWRSRPAPAGRSGRLFPPPLRRLPPIGQVRTRLLQHLPARPRSVQGTLVAAVEDDEASFVVLRIAKLCLVHDEQRLSAVQVLARRGEQDRLSIRMRLRIA